MELYYSADLYEAAFLLVLGAKFKNITEFHKNQIGRSFSIIALEDVTLDMLDKVYNKNSSVNFHKFREYRKKLKSRIDEYAKEHNYTSLTSEEVYKIHKNLKRQYKKWQDLYGSKSRSPKRIMQQEEGYESDSNSISSASMGTEKS